MYIAIQTMQIKCNEIHQVCTHICDQIWEKSPLTHKDKYLEIPNLIIQ